MSSPTLILLISGPIASGKTALRNELTSKHSFHLLLTSEYLKKIAQGRAIEINRRNLQELGDHLDISTNYQWVVNEVAIPTISQKPEVKWVVDAVRKEQQVAYFRRLFGASVFHVHMHAPEDVLRRRYNERLKAEESEIPTPYELAVAHPNEAAARALIVSADIVIDSEKIPVESWVSEISTKLLDGL